MRADLYPNTPRGETLDIPITYPVEEYGTFVTDERDGKLGEVVGMTWTEAQEAGIWTSGSDRAIRMAGEEIRLFALQVDGKPVATWDEGRWWTIEEHTMFMDILTRDYDEPHFARTGNLRPKREVLESGEGMFGMGLTTRGRAT